ncbi:hypothetical protein NPIL_193261 [Nephila pilipes]|uniref:Uncharacterized protein n=1 Tax=Nephila pilipes TaxID=299642 RepID=A0A8X6Q0W5_NEPPI|nr:hypothetical protein NPIL_193261 [Nephila pilipes]
MTASISATPNTDVKGGRRCALHMAFKSETRSRWRKLIENKVLLYMDTSRSEQHVVLLFLIVEARNPPENSGDPEAPETNNTIEEALSRMKNVASSSLFEYTDLNLYHSLSANYLTITL